MTRAITHIEQDIEDLEQEVVAIAQEVQETYSEYLEVLSEAVKQQVILTTYHLCTQGYPQRFLRLSSSQRQTLQQKLQSLAKNVCHDLVSPSSLEQLVHPFTAEHDGERDEKSDESEQDVMLRNLSAFVRRVLAEDSKSGGDDSSASDRSSSRDLSDSDGDSRSDGDRPSARLEAIIIPENFSFDFLSDAQLDSEDDDSVDFDADDQEDLEDAIEFQDFSIQASFSENWEGTDKSDESSDEDSEPDHDGSGAPGGTFDRSDGSTPESQPPQSIDLPHIDTGEESPSTEALLAAAASGAVLKSISSKIEKVESEPTPIHPTPSALIRRCKRLEKQIRFVVKQATDQTNQLLQETKILPKKLPNAVLEAALKADVSSNDAERSPNVLNLLVETSGNQDKPKMMHVKAVRLRVEEIEFNNPTLTAWRSRIRELIAQIQSLDKSYRVLQHEKHVVDAEDTWRATWYESEDR